MQGFRRIFCRLEILDAMHIGFIHLALVYVSVKQRKHALDNNAFEYDHVLEREPESNVVSLRMEGAKAYDFFHQL